jgi:hypothetical protein
MFKGLFPCVNHINVKPINEYTLTMPIGPSADDNSFGLVRPTETESGTLVSHVPSQDQKKVLANNIQLRQKPLLAVSSLAGSAVRRQQLPAAALLLRPAAMATRSLVTRAATSALRPRPGAGMPAAARQHQLLHAIPTQVSSQPAIGHES